MKCRVKRDASGKFVDVIHPITNKTDALYRSILSKTTKDPQSYLEADEFLRGLYSSGVLVDVTKEEIALGIWAKVHQYWINTGTSPVERSEVQPELVKDLNGDDIVDSIFTEYDDYIDDFNSFRSFEKINKQIEKNIKFYDSSIAKLRSEQRRLDKGDSERNDAIKKQLAGYERKKSEAEIQLQQAKALEGLEAIEQMAAAQLDEFEKLIDSGDLPLSTLEYVRDNLSFWKAIGTIDPFKEHILYTKEELTPDFIDRLTQIGARASNLDNRQIEQRLLKAERELPKRLKGNLEDLAEQLRHTKDIGFWSQQALDISAYGDPVLTWIQVLEKEAVSGAQVRIAELISKLETSFETVKGKLGKNYSLIQQKWADGTLTNRLVYRFSPEFFDAAKRAKSQFENTGTTKKYEEFAKWVSANEIIMNPIILFPTKLGDEYHWGQGDNMYSDYDESMRQAHIDELKATLGDRDFEFYKTRMEEKISRFVFQYNEQKRELENKGIHGEQAERMLKDWELENSPYYWVQRVLHGKKLENSQGIIVKNKGYTYTESIPRRFKADGTETGYYDKNYEAIQNDAELAEFYNQLLEITSELAAMLPESKRNELGINGLPFLKKDVTELFSRGNWIGMSKELYDQFLEMTRTQDFDDIDTQERDPFTGRVKFKAKLHLDTGEQAIKDLVNAKITRYKLENAKSLKSLSGAETKMLIDNLTLQYRKEAMSELQKERSEDLLTTMKAYIMTTVMYRHKANIEDTLNIMSEIAEDRSAFVVKDGVIQTEADGVTPLTQGEAKKKIEALRFNIQAFLTGRTHKIEGKSKKKILTSKEKTREESLKDLLRIAEEKFKAGDLTAEAYTAHKEALEEQISRIGGFLEASKVGDVGLRWVQLKGLGWNILSAINNMTFGYIANSVEASAGQFFTEKDLSIARGMLTSSVLTNASFNHYRDSKSKKIRKMIELYDILKDASTELYKSSNRSPMMSRFKWMNPFQLTKRTEYLNQGQTFIAHMLHEKIKDLEGVEFSLWEAFDDNGVWKTEQFGAMNQDKFAHTKTSVDQLIKRIHGNYDELSPVMGKESIAGRAIFQFKSWFPETWRKYFGAETPDHILGDQYKGRYITIWNTLLTGDQKAATGKDIALEFLRKYLNVTSFGLIGNFSDEKAFQHLTKVDMLNMKRNIHQFIFLTNLWLMYYLLKYMVGDDDDDKLSTALANVMIHQVTRLTGELEMYSSLTQLSEFAKNLIPATVIMKDLNEIRQATFKTIGGDYMMQSGAYEGWYRIPKEVGEAVPLLAPAMRYKGILSGESPSKEATLIEAAIGE